MDMDDKKTALVIGASGGIGRAVTAALTADPGYGDVVAASRSEDGVDITDAASLDRFDAALGERAFDLIFIATGVLALDDAAPEKSFAAIEPGAMARIFAVNTIGVAQAIKFFGPRLRKDRRSVFAALSARVGSIGDNRLGGWMSYRASKAALNQILRCAAVELGRTSPQAIVAALHPGTIETDLTRRFARGRYTASPDEAAAQLLDVLDRLTPEQSGGFFAYDGEEIPW